MTRRSDHPLRLGFAGLAIAVALAIASAAPSARAADIPVDLELVLAADISGSMDHVELALQRQGYLKALTNPRVIKAIRSGEHRRIAIAFVEWAGPHWQNLVGDWTLSHDMASARAIVEQAPLFQAGCYRHVEFHRWRFGRVFDRYKV